jgi:hypothetical protein
MTTTSTPSRSRTRLGAAAGLLGVAAALTAVTGLGPMPSAFQLAGVTEDVRGNCDEAEHANDAGCVGTMTARGSDDGASGSTSTTVDSSSTTANPAAPAGADVRTFAAGDAGSVLVQVDGASMQLLTASPNQGWRVEVERGAGREVEVTFRSGSLRVDLNLELEDGEIRVRVRTRDDATDTRTETENGVVVSDDSSDDNSGPGSDDSGHDSSDDDSSDDNSGPGSDDSGSDDSDDATDDNSGSGSVSDDSADDNSGSGSDDSGSDDSGDDSVSDDAPGDDNGGDRS